MFPIPSLALGWLKIGAVLAVSAALVGAGYKLGSAQQLKIDQQRIDKISKELADVKADFSASKVAWAEKFANDSAEAARVLAESVKKARDAETAAQAKIAKINQEWTTKVKRIKDEADLAIYRATHPVVSDDPSTDGLWVDVWACSPSPGNADSDNGVPKATSGTTDDPLRCRLHSSTAKRLIENAAEANEVVNSYNSCVDSLRILSPASFAN